MTSQTITEIKRAALDRLKEIDTDLAAKRGEKKQSSIDDEKAIVAGRAKRAKLGEEIKALVEERKDVHRVLNVTGADLEEETAAEPEATESED